MSTARLYTLMILLSAGIMNAQLRVIKPIVTHPKKTVLAFGAGVTKSVVYLNRNIKPDNDAVGYNISAVYGGHKLLRFSGEFTNYSNINIEPTWYDVSAYTLEANTHFLARFKSRKAVFYPIFG